jgi:Ni/Co efflux regulator RcnB
MSKLLATVAAVGFAALITALPASANERGSAGVSEVNSLEVSAAKRYAKRRHWRHHRAWRYYHRPYRYGYYPYDAYAYQPYYYRRGPNFYVGPGGFGFSWR